MNNAELSEAAFVSTGYVFYALVSSRFIMWLLKITSNNSKKVMIAFICLICAVPSGFFVIAILGSLYNILSMVI